MVFKECGTSCPLRCENILTPAESCKKQCVDGCTCPEGTYLHNGRCITAEQCPCTHNGVVYESGEILYQECRQW